MNKHLTILIMMFCLSGELIASNPLAPSGLMTELLSHPEKTYIDDLNPEFSWIVNDLDNDELQTSYQILVSSSLANLEANNGDLWDSGEVDGAQSVGVTYDGVQLTNNSYYWKVRTWDKDDNVGPYSEYQKFNLHIAEKEEAFTLTNSTISDNHLNLGKNGYVESIIGNNWDNYTFESRVKITANAVSMLFRLQDSNNFYMWQLSSKDNILKPHKKVGGNFSVLNTVDFTFENDTYYDVKIVLNGSSITTYIDGVLVDSTIDDTFATGKIGFRQGGTEVAEIDRITINNNRNESLLTGEFFDLTKSTVSGTVLSLEASAYVESVIGDNWDNYIFESKVKITADAVSVLLRHQDSDNFYMWQLSAKDNILKPHKKVGGTFSVLKEVDYTFETDTEYDVKIVLNGSSITTYIDGVLVDSTIDDTFATGKIGFRQGGAETAVVDSITVHGRDDVYFTDESFNLTNSTLSEGLLNLNKNGYVESITGNNWGNYTFESRVKITANAVSILLRHQDSDNFYMWQLSAKDNILKPHKKVGGTFSVLNTVDYTFETDTYYDIKIVLDGSNITTYIEGVLVDSTIDDTFATGKIGFRQGKTETAEVDNIKVYNFEEVLFKNESFDLTNSTLSEGLLNLDKNGYVESVTGYNWGDYTFESRVKITANAVSILLRHQDSDNFYMWQLSAKDNILKPHKKVGGTFSVLNTVDYTFETDTYYDIKIVLDGSSIITYIDGVLVNTTIDDTFTTGKIGFRQGKTETAEVDQISVRTLSENLYTAEFNALNVGQINYYSVESSLLAPDVFEDKGNGAYFIDFGKAAFGRLKFTLTSTENKTITIKFGEASEGNSVDATPANANVIYYSTTQDIKEGTHTYEVEMPNYTSAQSKGFSDVLFKTAPFRYCELINVPGTLIAENVEQEAVFYPFDDGAAVFSSSDAILNQVWDLSHYSMKATSWLGIYVDGNRERLPYEADAYIQQLGHMCTDRDAYSIARRSHEYLITSPTWPTEWTPHSVLMAYSDWMWTGDSESLLNNYDDLKAKTQHALTTENKLISTKTGLVTSDYRNSIHLSGTKYNDIVDWPTTERDGYVFEDYNTVVNAVHHGAIERFAHISSYLEKADDVTYFTNLVSDHQTAFNANLWSSDQKKYIDGIGTDHTSLHASAFAVAFGLADDTIKLDVAGFLEDKGMDCSVYGAQYFMEALYTVNEGQHALDLMRSEGSRSWYNMIAEGSTISMEAWGQAYKSNQDWNHAWGAAPANIIPRYLMGIRPLEPGFKKIQIMPQTGDLANASIKMPTVRGDVLVSVNKTDSKYTINLTTQANTVSKVYVPTFGNASNLVTVDAVEQAGVIEGEFIVFDNIGSGTHTFVRDYDILAVSSPKSIDDFIVFPNPSNGIFNLKSPTDWRVFSISGTIILEGNGSVIDLSEKSSGIFILKTDGSTYKLIKM